MKITRDLLERFSQGTCTPEEQQAIRSWIKDDTWPWYAPGEAVPDDLKETLWHKLQDNIPLMHDKAIRRRSRTGLWAWSAAAAAAVIVIMLLLPRHERVEDPYLEVVFSTTAQQHKRILLSDSSVVFLSPGSSIRLTQPFRPEKREIVLTGQAIFEAAHDAIRPFSVLTGDLVTTALGTSFKVTSFPGNAETKVALSYGKVVVGERNTSTGHDSLYLNPGEEAVYDRTTQRIYKSSPATPSFDYRNNVLYFKEAGLEEVVKKLSEYYGVEVTAPALRGVSWSVSGEFDYQPLSTVLQAIAYSCNIHYEIRDGRVILEPNS